MDRIRRRIQVSGVVQGVGFRPYVYRLATEANVAGHISNDTAGVTIEIEGAADAVEAFLNRLRSEAPPLAQISSVTVTDVPVAGENGFRITASTLRGAVVTQIPADAATCPDCLANCSIQPTAAIAIRFSTAPTAARASPSRAAFPTIVRRPPWPASPCAPLCQAEYDDPLNRRFHAQPNACWQCGPQLSGSIAQGRANRLRATQSPKPFAAWLRGEILAIKGIGGFHLSVDATNESAVQRLRQRKHRYGKPLAIMVRDVDAARDLCDLTARRSTAAYQHSAPHRAVRKRARLPRSRPPSLHRHSLARRLSALRAAAASALREQRAAGAGHDLRQPQRRAHRHRQRRSPHSPGSHRRRLSDPRSRNPSALR